MSCPSTLVLTVTVLSGVTEPSPVMYTWKLVFFACAPITGIAGGRALRSCPVLRGWVLPVLTRRAYVPLARTQTIKSRTHPRLKSAASRLFSTTAFFPVSSKSYPPKQWLCLPIESRSRPGGLPGFFRPFVSGLRPVVSQELYVFIQIFESAILPSESFIIFFTLTKRGKNGIRGRQYFIRKKTVFLWRSLDLFEDRNHRTLAFQIHGIK